MDTTILQLSELMSFIGVIYGNMGDGLLTGVEMTQRLYHQCPRFNEGQLPKTRKLGTHYTLPFAMSLV